MHMHASVSHNAHDDVWATGCGFARALSLRALFLSAFGYVWHIHQLSKQHFGLGRVGSDSIGPDLGLAQVGWLDRIRLWAVVVGFGSG